MANSAFLHTLPNVDKKWDLIELIGEGTYGQVFIY